MLRLKIVHHFLHVQQIVGIFGDEANHIYIAKPTYNLIEYSDNCSDTSGSLWQFKRDKVPANNNNDNNNNNNNKNKKTKGEKEKENVVVVVNNFCGKSNQIQ